MQGDRDWVSVPAPALPTTEPPLCFKAFAEQLMLYLRKGFTLQNLFNHFRNGLGLPGLCQLITYCGGMDLANPDQEVCLTREVGEFSRLWSQGRRYYTQAL